jgi:hypothetical protein
VMSKPVGIRCRPSMKSFWSIRSNFLWI